MQQAVEVDQLRKYLAGDNNQFDTRVERVDTLKRVIPPSRGCHVRGWHPTRKGQPSVPFESLLESRVISWLINHHEMLEIVSQPVTVHYRHQGRRHRYTPDFLVRFSSVPDKLRVLGFAESTLIEVKPYERAREKAEVLARQFAALRLARQCPVVLLTDRDIKCLTQAGGPSCILS